MDQVGGNDGIVDVIVPVYNNFEDAQRLFDSLASAANKTRCRLVIIDDASTEPVGAIAPRSSGHVVDVLLMRNEANLGFAATVNKGLRLSRRDVVILNTDTLVFQGWLDRLGDAATSHSRVATVTPLSNAATILSYPTFPTEFRSTLEIDWSGVDQISDRAAAAPVSIPTGVGFCMLITRDCIDAVGVFDEAAFDVGYGEECDFCRRAETAGWANLAAPNVFVWHRGEGSFGARATALRKRAQETLLRRHPNYTSTIADFIKRDPLLPARRMLDIGRITTDPRPCRLHLKVGPPARPASPWKDMFFDQKGRITPHYLPGIVGFANLPNLSPFRATSSRLSIEQFLVATRVEALVAYPRQGRASYLFRRFRRVATQLKLPVERLAA